MPTVEPACTRPATCVADSLPEITPVIPNAVCACCIVVTTAVACAVGFAARLAKSSAPGVPVNNEDGIA